MASRRWLTGVIAGCWAAAVWTGLGAAAEPEAAPPPIRSVRVLAQRAIEVNGEPFFPLMAWLQDPENFPAVKACGMNATAGYWPGSGGTKDVTEYMDAVARAGLYGVLPFDKRLAGHPNLLGYIHGDEPDLPRQVSDARVEPGPGLRLNRSTPLWRLVDGVWHSWSVLDPLEGARITIELERPVRLERLAVYVTTSSGLSVAKDVVFYGDGRLIAQGTLKPVKQRQVIALEQPAELRRLTMEVRSVYPGQHVWGSFGEIEGLNGEGQNVLLSPPRYEPRTDPEEVLRHYRTIKAGDPTRPVFMTLTGNFHPHFKKWSDAQREGLYPAYIRAADVVGYDIYPIYGWNKPEWIHLVHDATQLLTRLAGDRPVYAWIETSKGGQWTGPLERQKEVTPAHIKAEVWMAICGGATGIGYFTHVWKPAYRQFGAPEPNRRAIRQVNAQIARLAPAILSSEPPPSTRVRTTDGVRVAWLARRWGGYGHLFAVNADSAYKPTTAAFHIDGLPPGREVEVIGEGRRLASADGGLTDRFEPLAVHLYRWRE